jgi:hypothetical protein
MTRRGKTLTLTLPVLPVRKILIGLGVSCIALIAAFFVAAPPAPIVIPVSYTLTDQYGGVFSSSTTCAPYSVDYSWIAGEVSASQQGGGGSPTDLVATVSDPAVTRSSATGCRWDFFVSINPPEVGVLNRLVGQGQFPQSLGVFDIKLGREVLGSVAPMLENNFPVNLTRTVAVTNTIYGVARLGDLGARCTGDSGNFPKDWECTGRQVWDGYYWIGDYNYDTYRNITKFKIKIYKSDPSRDKCWGVNGFNDFKLGAKVTVASEHGTYTAQLARTYQVALPKEISMQRYEWYLASKSSKIMVCQYAWTITDLPFSKSGYAVTVGKRDPKNVTYEELVNGDWLVWSDFGNAIPSFTKN